MKKLFIISKQLVYLQLSFVEFDNSTNATYFRLTEIMAVRQFHRTKPKLGKTAIPLYMDMRWLVPVPRHNIEGDMVPHSETWAYSYSAVQPGGPPVPSTWRPALSRVRVKSYSCEAVNC